MKFLHDSVVRKNWYMGFHHVACGWLSPPENLSGSFSYRELEYNRFRLVNSMGYFLTFQADDIDAIIDALDSIRFNRMSHPPCPHPPEEVKEPQKK